MAKAKFERAKPHVNIGTIGHVDCGKAGRLVGAFLTREAVTAASIRDGAREAGGLLRRFAGVREVDEEARTVEVAFSSEEPVDRWFGTEILDHSPGACDLSRLSDGGAVLVSHRWDRQVGVVDSVRIDSDKVGRAVLRFSRSPEGEAIWQDIVDGIRRHVSVGYSVDEVRVESKEGMPDRVTLTRWQPYEISIVPVPADPTVGVGRAAGPPEGPGGEAGQSAPHRNGGTMPAPSVEGSRSMWETITENGRQVRVRKDEAGNIVERQPVEDNRSAPAPQPAPQPAPAIDSGATRAAGIQAERERTQAIMQLGRQYGEVELAAEYVAEGSRSAQEFQTALLDRVSQRNGGQSRQLSDKDSDDPRIGMSDAEVGRYSFIRAIRAVVNPTDRQAQEEASFELEASQAARSRMGRDAEGLVIPVDVLTRALNTATSGTNPGDSGGFLIDTTLLTSSFIDILRNRSVFMRRATPLGGLVGNLAIPKKTQKSQGYWIGEDEDAGETNVDFGEITLAPKTAASYTEITRRALMQTSLDVEALVRADIAEGIAETIDLAGWYGTGTGNMPLGIANVPGLAVVDFAGVYPTYEEIVAMETAVAVANADVAGMAYVMAAGARGALKTTPKFAGTGMPVWESGDTVNGYGTEVSGQIDPADVFHGNFRDELVGMWGGLEITTDPYTHSKKGRLRIVAMQDVDMQQRRIESFVLGKKPAV